MWVRPFQCDTECTDKCLPANNHHLRYLGGLIDLKGLEAVRCAQMAQMVDRWTELATQMERAQDATSRRKLLAELSKKVRPRRHRHKGDEWGPSVICSGGLEWRLDAIHGTGWK